MAELFEYIELLPSVLKLLASLKEYSIKTAIVTTDTIANTEAALRHLHIDHYFDAVIGKESTDEPKITGKPGAEGLAHTRPCPGRIDLYRRCSDGPYHGQEKRSQSRDRYRIRQ